MEELLTLLPAFVLWGSALAFWGILVLLIVIFFVAERHEEGYAAAISFAVFGTVTYFWSDFNILTLFTMFNIGWYIGIGIVYAIIRTYFYGRKKRVQYEDERNRWGDREQKSEDFRANMIDNLKDNVMRWWLLWPVSIINWILSDLVQDVFNWVYSKLGTGFNYVFDLGFKSND